MSRSLFLGTPFGIPLRVHWSFFLLPAYVLLGSVGLGLAGMLFSQVVLFTVFACVLCHELGHALMARSFGIGTRDITLYPVGGVARLESTGSRPQEELWISLAGPAVNLAFFLLLAPLALTLSLAGGVLSQLVTAVWLANGILVAFNLLPAFPMDGGRVLRAVLQGTLGKLRATEIASRVGLVMAGLIGLAGMFTGTLSLVLVACFVGFAGQMELPALRHAEAERRAAPVGFTGFAWDRDAGVWVRWVDGRPVEVYS